MATAPSTPPAPTGAAWSFCPLTAEDAPALAEVRAVAMRPSLEALGRYDPTRVRERFLATFDPTCTWGIVVDGSVVGCVALRPDGDDFWIEQFLLLPQHQGRSIGRQVLTTLLERTGSTVVRLNVLQGSPARALYERFGFVVDHEDPIDVFMVRHPADDTQTNEISPAPATTTPGRYLRIQARYCGRLGVEVGIFVAVDHLRRAGRLTQGELDTYLDIDDWFHEHLPEPPFYDDGNTVGAVTWFKNPAPPEMVERTERLMAILRAHDVEHDIVTSDDPGKVVYEDDYQVGVIPAARKPQTPLPDAAALGPTTAGSKRELPHGPVIA